MPAGSAYGGKPVYPAIASHQSDQPTKVTIPLREPAEPSTGIAEASNQRDRHIPLVAEKSRMAWQKDADHSRRSLAETTAARYKTIVSSRLRACLLQTQQGEAALAI